MFEKLPIRIITLILLCAIVLWIILSWRSDANAQASFPFADLNQDLSTVDPGQLIQEALRENFDIEASVTQVEDGADNDALLRQMVSIDQPFLLRIDGETSIYTPSQLFEEGLIDSVWSVPDWEVNARVGMRITGRETFYHVEFQGFSAIVAVDNLTFRGILPHLSRVVEERHLEQNSGLRYAEGCSEWLSLTNNLFGYPAEGLRSCMQATCKENSVAQCRTAAIPTFHGWATSISIDPGAPIDGLSAGQACNSLFGYTISHFVGNISVPIFEFAIGQSLSGAISSEFSCDGSVSIERR